MIRWKKVIRYEIKYTFPDGRVIRVYRRKGGLFRKWEWISTDPRLGKPKYGFSITKKKGLKKAEKAFDK